VLTNNNHGWGGLRIGAIELAPARHATVMTTLPLVCRSFQPFLEALHDHEVVNLTSRAAPPVDMLVPVM